MNTAAAQTGTIAGIETSVVVAILGFLGVVLAAIITQKYTARNARRAYEQQQEAESKRHELEQAKSWRDDTIELRRQREEDRREYEEDRLEWRREMQQMRDEISSLRKELIDVRAELHDKEEYTRQLVTWCKVVVVLLRQNGIAHPDVPPGIDTNPKGIRAQDAGQA